MNNPAPIENVHFAPAHRQRLAIAGMGSIPLFPASWYRFGAVQEIATGPISKDLLGERLVAFQTHDGRSRVMDARCSHMHADLGNGRVVKDCIECPFHHWKYGTDGECKEIPCADQIPSFARQLVYPTQVRHGQIYFFFGSKPLFELPFFFGEDPQEFSYSRVALDIVEAPWYMISINSVDMQHFRIAHDRELISDPKIDHPDPMAHRASLQFQINGSSWSDRFTRLVGGRTVGLEVTEWAGSVVLARSTLQRAETFGMLFMQPLHASRTLVHIMVLARKSPNAIGRMILDPLRTTIRAKLIRRFLRSDIPRLKGSYVHSLTLLSQDQAIADYLQLLCRLPCGGPA
jgi:phenylpropionate dioxygenase-like ring-hydroxylating dioxygenase large terminal subunit